MLNRSVPGNPRESGNWILCARENEICHLPEGVIKNGIIYTQNVNTTGQPSEDHGDMSNPSQREVFHTTDGFAFPCNNDSLFGDPAPGIPKLCYYSTSQLPRGNLYREKFLVDEETGQYNTLFYLILILIIFFLIYSYINKNIKSD